MHRVEGVMSSKADRITQELVATEQTYVDSLQDCVTYFEEPLRQQNLITSSEINAIFLNIRPIRDLHVILLQDLRKANGDLSSIAAAFGKISKFFRIYMEFINGFTKSAALLAAKKSKSVPVREFLNRQKEKAAQENQRPAALDLESLLIQPVQRIPRYVLLLRELVEATGSKELSSTTETIHNMAEEINETSRNAENMNKIVELQSRFKGWNMVFVQPQRRFIAEIADCQVESKKCSIFVFTDLVIAAQKQSDSPNSTLCHIKSVPITRGATIKANGTDLCITGAKNQVTMTMVLPSVNDCQNLNRTLVAQLGFLSQWNDVATKTDALGGDVDALQPCLYQNWLDKKSSSSHRWLERWVQLRGNTLFWSDGQQSSGTPSGMLSLLGKQVIVAVSKTGDPMPNCIEILGGAKTYLFRRDRRSELVEWLKFLDSSTAAHVTEEVRQTFLQDTHAAIDFQIVGSELNAVVKAFLDGGDYNLVFVIKERRYSITKSRHSWHVLGEPVIIIGVNFDEPSLWLPVKFHTVPILKLSLYAVSKNGMAAVYRKDFESVSCKKCGSAIFSPAELMKLSKTNTLNSVTRLPLSTKGKPTGFLEARIGSRFQDHSKLLLQGVSANNLHVKKTLGFGKCDPVLSLQGMTNVNKYTEVFRGDVQRNTEDPCWNAPISVDLLQLCGGDYDKPFMFQVLNHPKDKVPSLIGQCKTRMAEFIDTRQGNNSKTFHLHHPVSGESKSKGQLVIKSYSLTNRYSFFHYLLGSLSLRLVIGVDFSSQNGEMFSNYSLHHSSKDNSPTQSYMYSLKLISSHLVNFFDSHTIEAWGISAEHSECFELGGTAGVPEVDSVGALMEGYENARKLVRRGKSVVAKPFMQRVIASASNPSQDNQQLTVGMCFVPQVPTDVANVRKLLVGESDSNALMWTSLICIGGGIDGKASLGFDSSVDVSLCTSNPEKHILRSLFHALPEAIENKMKARGVVPSQYLGKEPKSNIEKTAASRHDYSVKPSRQEYTSGGSGSNTPLSNTPYSPPSSNNPYGTPASSNPYGVPAANSTPPHLQKKKSTPPTRYPPPQSQHNASPYSSNHPASSNPYAQLNTASSESKYYYGGPDSASQSGGQHRPSLKPHLQVSGQGQYFGDSGGRKVVSVTQQYSSGTGGYPPPQQPASTYQYPAPAYNSHPNTYNPYQPYPPAQAMQNQPAYGYAPQQQQQLTQGYADESEWFDPTDINDGYLTDYRTTPPTQGTYGSYPANPNYRPY